MNKTNHLLPLGAALLLAPLTATFAQSTWETVDELSPWRGRDIVADAAGNFISLAIDNGAIAPVATAVSLSPDGGATWDAVGFIAGYALDLAAAPDGALFAVGNRSATVSGRAFLWQSVDQGASWTEINPGTGQSGTFLCLDVAAGNSGDVYLCGYLSGGSSWVVRKGHPATTGGFTWSTVDTQTLGQPQTVFVRPGLSGQPDEVLVGGGAFTVRRSLNGGSTWTTLPSAASTYTSQSAYALTVSPNGAIYVTGRTSKTVGTKKTGYTTQYGWLTRRSTTGGTTWTDVDYVANAQPAYSSGLTVDALDRVLAVGFSSNTPNSWLVRGSIDGGATWSPTDSLPSTGTIRAQALAVASDALGNVCVIGETGTTVSTYTAPIRRLAAP